VVPLETVKAHFARREFSERITPERSDITLLTGSNVIQCKLTETERSEMPKSAMMTVRLTPETNEKLEALARDTKRSKSYLATEAIESYVDRNAWQVARIKESLVEAKSGAPGVPHAKVVKWMKSWGTDRELRRPTARKS
jgi:predicted transcriptional regulator